MSLRVRDPAPICALENSCVSKMLTMKGCYFGPNAFYRLLLVFVATVSFDQYACNIDAISNVLGLTRFLLCFFSMFLNQGIKSSLCVFYLNKTIEAMISALTLRCFWFRSVNLFVFDSIESLEDFHLFLR